MLRTKDSSSALQILNTQLCGTENPSTIRTVLLVTSGKSGALEWSGSACSTIICCNLSFPSSTIIDLAKLQKPTSHPSRTAHQFCVELARCNPFTSEDIEC